MSDQRTRAELGAILAARIRRLRAYRTLTLRGLASRADICYTSVHNTEKGHGNVTLWLALRIAEGLGVPLELLTAPPECEQCLDVPPPGHPCPSCGKELVL